MSCNTCQKNFSFFIREKGCPSCGFSYCGKCLKYSIELPEVGVKKVCGKCFNHSQMKKVSNSEIGNSSSVNESTTLIAPVDITTKLDLLENPSKPPIVMYKQESTRWNNLKAGLEPDDLKIIDRLKKLREEDKQKPPPSIDEIKRRLALLKDKDLESIESSPFNIHQIDTRTDEQKVDNLLEQYLENLNIKHNPIDDLQARLDSLKDIDPSKISTQPSNDEDESEISQTKRIIKKALEEAAIEAKFGTVNMEEDLEKVDTNEEDELMCDECGDTDNLAWCKGCKGKLYCSLCFEDNHDEDEVDLRKHVKVPVKNLNEFVDS